MGGNEPIQHDYKDIELALLGQTSRVSTGSNYMQHRQIVGMIILLTTTAALGIFLSYAVSVLN